VPIGRALDLPPRLFNEDLYQTVRAIDSVHGDGDLPGSPVLLRPELPAFGRFVIRGGVPSEILINPNTAHRGFALLHEVGHFLDFAALGKLREFGSLTGASVLAHWRRAAEASDGLRSLREAVTEFVSALPVDAVEMRRRLERPLTPEEVWARSYAQYVATQSAEPLLLAGLEAFRTERLGTVYYPMHWEDDDFRPIGDAIERSFRGFGWRTKLPS
jgi:hypothetical protein